MDSDRASQLSGVDSFIAGGVNTTSPSSPEAVKQQQQQQSQSHNDSHSETDGHSNDQPIAQQQQSEPSILSTVPTLPFAEHFWGPKDEGVKVLLTRMKAGRKTLEGLREMFAERASFEETYGNRLRKLGKVALGQDELGSVRRSLETVNAEMALFAQSHLDLANDIRTILEAPTMMKVREQKSIVKEHQQLVEKNVQARHEIRSQLNKARERIEKEENNMKSIDNPTFGLFQTKDPEKIRVKKDKAIQARINAINEHKALERKLADAQRQWGEDWKMVCNKFEILEEERIHFIREIMFQYSNVMSNVCTKDEETYDRVKNELDRVDPQFELYTFVSERRTGGPETTPGILVPMSTAQYDSSHPSQPAPIATAAPTTQIPPMSASAAIAPATAQSNSRPSTPIQQQQTRSRSPSFVSINNNNGEQTTPANIKQQASAGSAAIASPSATSSTPQHQQQPSHASKGTDRRPILFYCRVLYDWAPETDAEIALKEGMIISVFEEAADGWWTGEITDPSTGDLQRGIFPSNYTQRMSF
ncbi:hypothetical protein GQ42DRAFT_151552 [Ramicandelaber brevisporus]|nr:hypothetical protein GQ42DRAFT_151552 [Ramicandelaber brevisporus]